MYIGREREGGQIREELFSCREEPRPARSTSVLDGPQLYLEETLGLAFREMVEVSGLLFSFWFLSNFSTPHGCNSLLPSWANSLGHMTPTWLQGPSVGYEFRLTAAQSLMKTEWRKQSRGNVV